MKDLLGLMGKAKEMQAKLQELQDGMVNLTAIGQSGGGLVTVTLNGKGDLQGLKIDPSLIRPDEAEIVEDLVIAAHSDARVKLEAIVQDKTRELTAGLPIPAGFKLPF